MPETTEQTTTTTIDEAMDRIHATGRTGISVWCFKNSLTGDKSYMGCLLGVGSDCNPDYDTNLWNYTKTAAEAIRQLAEKAEKLAGRRA